MATGHSRISISLAQACIWRGHSSFAELCSFHKLAVTNTFFQHKDRHKVSWRHPKSKHWHQLDMTLTKRRDLNNVQNTRSITVPTATRTTSSSARRYSLSHARCTTLRPRVSHASTPAAYHAQSQPRDSAKPSKHRWRKAEEMSPLQVQSGNKCEPPSTNRGWRPLGRKSVATRTGSRRTGRKWSQS